MDSLIGDFSTFFALIAVGMAAIGLTMAVLVANRTVRAAAQAHADSRAPIETVEARIVAKRTNVDGTNGMQINSTHTLYYCTFELTTGDRREFRLSGEEYGQLAEGDIGRLSCQGSRFLGFARAAVVG